MSVCKMSVVSFALAVVFIILYRRLKKIIIDSRILVEKNI